MAAEIITTESSRKPFPRKLEIKENQLMRGSNGKFAIRKSLFLR